MKQNLTYRTIALIALKLVNIFATIVVAIVNTTLTKSSPFKS